MQCNPYTGLERPLGLQEVETPRISIQSAHEGGKFISPTYWLPLVPGDTLGTNFFWGLSQPQGHSVARRNKSLKNPYDPIWNRTCNHVACSAMSQPSALTCTPLIGL